MNASIGGAPATRVIFDTGCACSILTFDYFARRYPSAFTGITGSTTVYGTPGQLRTRSFPIPQVKLGTLTFANVNVLRAKPSSFGDNHDRLFGRQLLAPYTVGLDYAHDHIYISVP